MHFSKDDLKSFMIEVVVYLLIDFYLLIEDSIIIFKKNNFTFDLFLIKARCNSIWNKY